VRSSSASARVSCLGSLARRGLRVTAIDIDPLIEDVAREYFSMPAEVRVEIADARAFLRRHDQTYDLIVLDVFAGESGPWHLNTVEAFADMARRLNPGGRLVINTVAMAATPTMGLARMEAALLRVFPELRVFSSAPAESSADALVNVTLVAGADLAGPAAPGGSDPIVRGTLERLLPLGRDGRAEVEPATDDWSDVDYRDAEMRARWRSEALAILPSS
jgi:SAM-dependent methyltransferase